MNTDRSQHSRDSPDSTNRQMLAEAALANLNIRDFLADPKLGRVWIEESIRRCQSAATSGNTSR